MKYLYIAPLMTVALVGCASIDRAAVTPYQSGKGFSMRGGYSEKKTSDTTYEVTFTGNGYATSKMVGDFAIMRGAELCQMAGFTYFRFVKGTITTTRVFYQGIPSAHPEAVADIECLADSSDNAKAVDETIAETRATWHLYIPKSKK